MEKAFLYPLDGYALVIDNNNNADIIDGRTGEIFGHAFNLAPAITKQAAEFFKQQRKVDRVKQTEQRILSVTTDMQTMSCGELEMMVRRQGGPVSDAIITQARRNLIATGFLEEYPRKRILKVTVPPHSAEIIDGSLDASLQGAA